MIARKERYMKSSGSEVVTLPEIAAKLRETPMVRGKNANGVLQILQWAGAGQLHSWEATPPRRGN